MQRSKTESQALSERIIEHTQKVRRALLDGNRVTLAQQYDFTPLRRRYYLGYDVSTIESRKFLTLRVRYQISPQVNLAQGLTEGGWLSDEESS